MFRLLAKLCIGAAALSTALCSCNRSTGFVRIDGNAQGTYYSVQYYDSQGRNFRYQIDSLLQSFDLSASLWVEKSTLNKLNGGDSVLDDITTSLLEKSLLMTRYTNGAFDCRVGKLVNAWGFGAKCAIYPDSATVDSLLNICRAEMGMRYSNNGGGKNTLWRSDRRTEIDFNAIAQGFSVDLLSDFLQSKGISNFLIDIGGEVIARGCKKDGRPWIVGIEKPAADRYSTQKVLEAVALRDAALVTSGNYRKYYEQDGIRYSHTIDPLTGHPVNHSLLSVTVVDSTAWRADALATAFMVMGLDSALRFIDMHPEINKVFFIYDENGQYKSCATREMENMIAGK